jgi:hypothetical protein
MVSSKIIRVVGNSSTVVPAGEIGMPQPLKTDIQRQNGIL